MFMDKIKLSVTIQFGGEHGGRIFCTKSQLYSATKLKLHQNLLVNLEVATTSTSLTAPTQHLGRPVVCLHFYNVASE